MLQGLYGTNGTPVKLHAAADAVRARTQHNHSPVALRRHDVVADPVIGQVEVVRAGREFGCERVYLLDMRPDAQTEPVVAHLFLAD